MTIESSDPISTQAVISGGSSAATAGASGTVTASASPPPSALTPAMNERRLSRSREFILSPKAVAAKRQPLADSAACTCSANEGRGHPSQGGAAGNEAI